VSDVGAQLVTDGTHDVSAGADSCQVACFKSASTVKNNTNLLVGGDLARSHRSAIAKHFKITAQVGGEKWDVYEITPVRGRVQCGQRLHHTASQEGITKGGLLLDVGNENLGDDHVTPKSCHD